MSEERLPQSHVSGSPRFNEKISPVMQATGVKEIKPILLVSRRPRNSILYRGEFGHGIVGTNCWLRGGVGRFADRNRSLRSESSNVITTFFDDSFCRKLDR